MGSQSTKAQKIVIALAVLAALVTWVIEALIGGVIFADPAVERSLIELLLGVTLQTWVLRFAVLLVFVALGVIVARMLPDEEVVEELEQATFAPALESFARDARTMILGLDTEGRIMFFNRRCEAITGHSADDVVGRSFFDAVLPPRSLPIMTHAVRSVAQKGAVIAQETAWTTDRGREIIVASECSPVRDQAGEVVGVAICASETTEFRWSEMELEQARQPYLPLVESVMGDGLAAFDLDGKIIWASESLARLTGHGSSELTEMACHELASEQDRERLQQQIEACLQGGERVRMQFLAATQDDGAFPAAISAVPVEQPEDGIVGGFAVIRNISDIVEVASDLASAADQLHAEAAAVEQARVEQLETELASAIQHGEDAQHRLAEREEELAALQAEVDAVEERVEAAREEAQAEARAEVEQLQGQIAEARSEAAQAEDAVRERYEARVAELSQQLEEAEERVEAAREEAQAEARAEVEQLQGQVAEARSEAAQAEDAMREQYEARVAELSQQLEQAEERVEAAREEAQAEARAEVEQLQEQVAEARSEAAQAEDAVREQYEARVAELTQQLEQAEERAEQVRREALADREEELAALQAEVDAVEERVETARQEAQAEARAEVEQLQGQVAEARSEAAQAEDAVRERYEAQVAELTQQLEQAEERIEAAREEAQADARAEVEQLQGQVAEARSEAAQAEDAVRERYEARVAELAQQLEEAEERVEAAREEAQAEARAEVEQLQGQVAEARSEAAQAETAVRERYEARVAELTQQLEQAEERAEQVRREALAEREEELAALQAEVDAVEERIETAREEAQAEARAEVEQLQGQVAEARSEAAQAEDAVRERYEARVAELSQQLEQAEERAEQVRREALAEREEELAALQAEVDAVEERVEAAREQGREAAHGEFASRLSGLSAQLVETERRVAATEEHLRTEYAEEIAELSQALSEAERRVEEVSEQVRAEHQERIDQLAADLEDAERRAQEARKLAREEYEAEIAQSLAEAARVDERVEQARAGAVQEFSEQIDSLAAQLADAERQVQSARRDRDLRLRFMQQLFDGIPYPVVLIDRDGVVQTCNSVFASRLLGSTPAEVAGTTVEQLGDRAGEALVEALERSNREVFEHGKEETYEAVVPCADGGSRLHAFRKEPCLGEDGEVSGVVCAMLDLSVLQETQEMIEREREQIATMLDRAPAVIAEIRPDGTTAAVYGGCESLLGWAPQDLAGRDWWQTLFPDELSEPALDALGAMRAGGDINDRALTTLTADGDRRVISWSSANARGPNRELLTVFLVGHDITERARNEEARELQLREQRERNRRYACLCNALRLTQDPQLSLNEMIAGIVAEMPQAWRYPGITTASITVYDRERGAGDATGEPFARQTAEISVNSEVVGEIEVRYHEERPTRADGPFTAGERDLLDLLADLIGQTIEYRSAEDSRTRLLQFHQTAAEQVNVWFMVLDREHNVVEWNRRAEEISGYSRREVLGHDDLWRMLFPDEEMRREVTREVARITIGRSTAESWETTITCKDGEERVISWNARRLLEDDGTIIGAVFLGRDVTSDDAAASHA